MIYRLSPSAMNVYRDCPRCFWLTKVKSVSRPRGIFPSLPSGMDRGIKGYFDGFRANHSMPPEIHAFDNKLKFKMETPLGIAAMDAKIPYKQIIVGYELTLWDVLFGSEYKENTGLPIYRTIIDENEVEVLQAIAKSKMMELYSYKLINKSIEHLNPPEQ